MVSRAVTLLLFPLLAFAAEPDALAISANIQAKHLPFGTVLDPVYAFSTSAQITAYTHCGDSAIWTGHYLAAEAFRYQVTRSPEALDNARRAVAGLKSLVDVTGINLLARCAVPLNSPYLASIQGEESHNGLFSSQASGMVWVGNTSRDQYSGAMFGLGIAYDLIDDAPLRASIADLVTRMIDSLQAHLWTVIMPDLSVSTTFIGRQDQILALLAIARHVNPARFSVSFDSARMAAAEMIAPVTIETFSDSSYYKFNLDYINLYGLLRLDQSDAAKTAYGILRFHTDGHQNPHFNMIDRALRGPDRLRDSETLALLDAWLTRPRRDAFVDLHGKVNVCGDAACDPAPVALRPPSDFLWQRSPFLLTGGGTGTTESAGIDYILPYWMSRYFGVGQAFSVQSAAAGTLLVAPDSIASVYGANIAKPIAQATSLPLPTTLGGVTMTVRDSAGVTRSAQLLYVSPGQINFIVPAGTMPGIATFTTGTSVSTGMVAGSAPALFTVNSMGNGPAAGSGPTGDSLTVAYLTGAYFILYGTGIRGHSSITATVGDTPVQITYAGAQGQFAGLDQVNLLLPAALRGTGVVNVQITVDGIASNPATMALK